jgi:hypothetical protein
MKRLSSLKSRMKDSSKPRTCVLESSLSAGVP